MIINQRSCLIFELSRFDLNLPADFFRNQTQCCLSTIDYRMDEVKKFPQEEFCVAACKPYLSTGDRKVKRKVPFPTLVVGHIMNLFQRVYLDVNPNPIQTHKSASIFLQDNKTSTCVCVLLFDTIQHRTLSMFADLIE